MFGYLYFIEIQFYVRVKFANVQYFLRWTIRPCHPWPTLVLGRWEDIQWPTKMWELLCKKRKKIEMILKLFISICKYQRVKENYWIELPQILVQDFFVSYNKYVYE